MKAMKITSTVAGFVTKLMLVIAVTLAIAAVGSTVLQHSSGYHSYAVLSGSMEPKYPVGGLVLTHPVSGATLKAGDVITFHPPGQPDVLITHRIYQAVDSPSDVPNSAGKRYFITKGDANEAPDRWRVSGEGPVETVQIGIPKLGYVLMAMSDRRTKAALLGFPGMLLVLILLIEVWRPKPKGQLGGSPA
jgi:signal peptidase